MSIDLDHVHDCPRPAAWTLEATDRGTLVRVLLTCEVHAEALTATYLRGYTVDAIPAPEGRVCGRSAHYRGGPVEAVPEAADGPDLDDTGGPEVVADSPTSDGGGFLVVADPDEPDTTASGDPAEYVVIAAVGGNVLGRVLADDSGDRFMPVVAVAGRDVCGPSFDSFGDAVLWVVARLTVVVDAPRTPEGAASPLDTLEHGYRRKGAIWQSGYDGYPD